MLKLAAAVGWLNGRHLVHLQSFGSGSASGASSISRCPTFTFTDSVFPGRITVTLAGVRESAGPAVCCSPLIQMMRFPPSRWIMPLTMSERLSLPASSALRTCCRSSCSRSLWGKNERPNSAACVAGEASKSKNAANKCGSHGERFCRSGFIPTTRNESKQICRAEARPTVQAKMRERFMACSGSSW